MKTPRFICFALALACFAAVLLPAEAQVILNPNTIRGTIRFSNVNPDVLTLLNEPGNEGMKFAAVSASSLPPAPAINASTEAVPAATRTSTPYEITVDSDAAGIAYGVTPSIIMLDGAEYYYFATRNSEPVVAGGPPVTLDFEECVGVVTVRFVDAAGAPVAVDSGQIIASGYQYQRNPISPGSTEARIYLLGGQAHPLAITVNRGTDFYLDRLTFALNTDVKVNCDEFSTVDMVIPDPGDLGKITGQVDMLGEFELTVDGRDDLNYPDSTGVIAQYGPFQNQRWAALKGTHFTVPSSGAYELPNIAATTLDPASPGYVLYTQMYFRTGRQVESFRSPALGSGANAALQVSPARAWIWAICWSSIPATCVARSFCKGRLKARTASHSCAACCTRGITMTTTMACRIISGPTGSSAAASAWKASIGWPPGRASRRPSAMRLRISPGISTRPTAPTRANTKSCSEA
ncbi:MAG: hypothetical protein HYY24_16920 [Verrucomicrobia bacterium]|nr:hypothetical protein [Verrucomicrobiota bacterium]